MMNGLAQLYNKIVLGHPKIVLTVLSLLLAFFSYYAKDFKLDASPDTLLLEDDKDLKTFYEISDRYNITDFLFITFSPHKDLFSKESLQHLQELREALRSVERVESVDTILDIPLLKTSDIELSKFSSDNVKTLEDPGIDLETAKKEIRESPIYKDLVLSDDGQTTNLIVYLKQDIFFSKLIKKRNLLLEKEKSGTLSRSQQSELETVIADYKHRRILYSKQQHQNIEKIRSILQPFKKYGVVHLGGTSMITDDMISYVKNDLVVFGFGVFIFIVATLVIIFREIRWVILPLMSCFFSVLIMIGMLGFLNWKVTVISSNFISLMLILTMSMNIHLAVRYRQVCRDMPSKSHPEIVFTMAGKMVRPCLYTALTTIIAFSSFVFSGIKPIIDFGWMMAIGLSVTFFTSFLLLPATLVLLKKSGSTVIAERQSKAISGLAWIATFHGGKVIIASILLTAISLIGISRLKVENSFINYFSENTEIYQGMRLIDEKLGGTNPLDIILTFGEQTDSSVSGDTANEGDDDLLAEDDWAGESDPRAYWLTPYKVKKIKEVHDYLDGLPEIGKVLSLASMIRAAEELNDGKEFEGIELGVLLKKIPEKIKSEMIDPYISIEHNEARFSVRVLDSLENLRRKELLEKIKRDLNNKFQNSNERVTVAGMLVLYNNMLQSLFKSQVLTLGIVLFGIGFMFLILFRSISFSIIGIVPNLLAVAMVLGIMGLLDIPLDMMTITIAAITMGIGVDDCIHYLYRFKEDFISGNYAETIRLCHRNVGKAIINTSITIMFGFSILVLSNFIPTIYFGVFTGMAMFIALLSVLILLPKLILLLKPLKSYYP